MAAPANLTTLIKRLEAATSRLEDLTTASAGQQVVQAQSEQAAAVAAASGPTTGQPMTGTGSSAPASAAPAAPESPAFAAYEELRDGQVKSFVEAAEAVGGIVAKQVRVP